jgi:hypothetical protein
MRLIPTRRHHRPKLAPISISQAEITADLHYPAPSSPKLRGAGGEPRGEAR